MPITVFPDVVLTNNVLAGGIKGKNARMNSRVPTENGFESINVIWTQTKREYALGVVPLRVDQWQAIETLHEITEGGAYGFLLEDPKDSVVTDGICTFISEGVFQLHKRYVHGPSTRFKTRKITRPRAPGFVLKLGGIVVGPEAYTLDLEKGRLLMMPSPPAEALTWSGRFYVPVHFLDDSIDWDMVVNGSAESRYIAGPTVVVQEIRE